MAPSTLLEVRVTRNRGPAVPDSPFSTIVPLFLDPVDSDLYAFLDEAHALIQEAPLSRPSRRISTRMAFARRPFA